jgi:hypothetical protein
MRDESRITLQKAARLANGRFRYECDFGDGWQHDIFIERESPWEKGSWVPVCLEGAYACPPEDCGGPSGFADLLEAASNPDHERHLEMQPWLNERGEESFDPERLDLALMNKVLKWVAQDLRRHAHSR